MTSDGGPGTSASRPLMARATQTNRVPSSTGVPQRADARLIPAPASTANTTVWVMPRWVPRPVSREAAGNRQTSAENGRTSRDATIDAHENRRVAAEDG